MPDPLLPRPTRIPAPVNPLGILLGVIIVGVAGCKVPSGKYPSPPIVSKGCIQDGQSNSLGAAPGIYPGITPGMAPGMAPGIGSLPYLASSSAAYQLIAQPFLVTAPIGVSVVSLELQAQSENGQPLNAELTLSIEQDNFGTPSGVALGSATLATSGEGNVPPISTSAPAFYPFEFFGQVQLQPQETNWLVLNHSYENNSVNFIEWLGGAQPTRQVGQALFWNIYQQQWSNPDFGTGGMSLFFKVGC